MIIALPVPPTLEQEQCFLLPRDYSWEEFEAVELLLADSPGLRLTYLDGQIELMTLGEPHEQIKSLIGMFLEAYFIALGIEFTPVGSATRRGQQEGTSCWPDESYYLGERKANPDLAIEVILTSGNRQKLEKYRRFEIPEVWLWEKNQLKVYCLQANTYYVEMPSSQLLPGLDLDLLVRCVQMPSRLAAMQQFMAGITQP